MSGPERVGAIEPGEWRWLCERLEARAGALRDPVAVARVHHQRARILADELGAEEEALAAWGAALGAWSGHVPTVLALRERALRREDRPLGERVFDRSVAVLTRPGSDPADAAEVAGFFLLVWLFRWPDAERAARAVVALDAVGDPEGLGERLGPVCLPAADRARLLRRRVERSPDPYGRARAAAELAELLLSEPGPSDALELLREAAAWDVGAAWRLVEEGARRGDDRRLADALVELAGCCGEPAGGALRFLAAELYELRLGAPERAEPLYDAARAGQIRVVVGLKRVLRAARAGGLVLAEALAGRQSLGEPELDGTLARRAGELYARGGDAAHGFALARRALDYQPDSALARQLLKRLAARAGQWAAVAPLLDEPLRAALAEHVERDRQAARRHLGAGVEQGGLREIRTRQRLAADPDERRRLLQLEVNLVGDGDRRADLHAQLGRAFMEEAGAHEKALTYLFWALDHDPENLVALRLVAHVCREARRFRPLMEALSRALPLLDRPEDRAGAQRELGALWEAIGRSPEQAAEHYQAALVDDPRDDGTVADLERLYRQLGRDDSLREMYETLLRDEEDPERRSRLSTALSQIPEAETDRPRPAPPVESVEISVSGLDGLEESTDTAVGPVDDAELEELVTGIGGLLEAERSLPPLPPLEPLDVEGGEPDGASTRDLTPPRATSTGSFVSLDSSGLRDIPPAEPEALDFLGEERAPDRAVDPGRAMIARKLKRARGEATEPAWPDYGDPDLAIAVAGVERAREPDDHADGAAVLGAAYELAGHPRDAIRAWRAVLGFRAGDVRAHGRLEALYRSTEDWRGLVEVLDRAQSHSGDPERRRELLIEIARLEAGPLNDPARAIDHYREAATLGLPDRTLIAELAGALRDVRRWNEYVEVLSAGALGEPEVLDPASALELGRVHLYELGDAQKALPYVLRAARALPERVDVAADLAEARALTGDVDRAADLLRGASEAAAGDARVVLQLRLARLYEEHGADPDRARAWYRSALEGGARDPGVLDRIERLAVAAHDWETLALVVERYVAEAEERAAPVEERRALAKRLGHLYYKRLDRPRDAAEVFVRAYELEPTDAGVYRIAEGLLQRQPVPALQVRLHRTWLAQAPADAPGRVAVGLRLVAAHEAEGDLDAAVERLEEMRGIAAADPEVLGALERVYRRAERWPELVEMYRESLRGLTQPEQRPVLLRRLAQALEVGLRDLPGTTEVWWTLHELDPADVAPLQALARLLEAQKRWRDLLTVSERQLAVVSSDRQRAYIHFRMGSLQETQLGDLEAATRAYRTALTFDPRCFPALHGLREISAAAGHWSVVVEHLLRELELWDEPRERAAVLSRIAEIHDERMGDAEGALRRYREAISTWPTCIPAARALADHAFAERWEEAAPYFQVLTRQSLDKWPRSTRADLFYRRGVVAVHLGRNHEAAESLKLALEFDPDHAEALQALVRAYAALPGQDDGLRTVLTRLDEAYADHAEGGRVGEQARIDILRGYAAEQALDLDDAAAHYERATGLVPGDLETLRPLVELRVKQRRWGAATAALLTFAEAADPSSPAYVEALLWAGDLWGDMAVDPVRAMACYAEILAVRPGYRAAWMRIAGCHFLQGAFEEARECVERLLEFEGVPPEERAQHHFYLGRVRQVGFHDVDGAVDCFEAALREDKRCASALLGLLRLRAQSASGPELRALLEAHAPLVFGEVAVPDPAHAALKTFAANLLARDDDGDGARRLLEPLAHGQGRGARDARFALAPVLEAAGEWDGAAAQLLRCVDANACDLAALQALADLFDRAGEDERLLHVLATLDLFKSLGEWEPRFRVLRERARKIRDKGAARALSGEQLARLLHHPSFRSPVIELVRRLDLALEARFPGSPRPALKRSGLASARRHPFFTEERALTAALGAGKIDVYFSPDVSGVCRAWPGQRPLVVVGSDGLGDDFTTAQRAFLVARAVFYCEQGVGRLHDLGTERAIALLQQVGALLSPKPDGGEEEASLPSLLQALSPRAREGALRLLGEAQHPLPSVHTGEAVLLGLTRTADRAGLLGCGALRPAVETLAARGGGGLALPPESDLTWAVRSRSRLRDLVKYALSESHHQLRRAVGLSV